MPSIDKKWSLVDVPPTGHSDVADFAFSLFEIARLEKERLGKPRDFLSNYATVAVLSPAGVAVPQQFNFPYNRQTDGVDTLMFCHEGIQAALMGMGIDSTIEGLN